MEEIVSLKNEVVRGKTRSLQLLCDCPSCSVFGDVDQRKHCCFPGSLRCPRLNTSGTVLSSHLTISASRGLWALGKEDAIPAIVEP